MARRRGHVLQRLRARDHASPRPGRGARTRARRPGDDPGAGRTCDLPVGAGAEARVGSPAVAISKVGVVGLGTMGAGIAQVCIQAGFETVGREVSDELCDRARGTIGRYLARGVEKGRLTQAENDAALTRLTTTTDLGDLGGCDLVIEAIVEELEAKRALVAEL